MSVIDQLKLDRLSPHRVWQALDDETRLLAAKALYQYEWDDKAARKEADAAIAAAIHFREVAIRKLPLDKRAEHLANRVKPDDSLATSLLMALHLVHRNEMLGDFLDGLDIPHQDGIIDESYDPVSPDAGRLRETAARLRDGYPDAEVDLYLASLLSMDDEWWGGLHGLLAERQRRLTG